MYNAQQPANADSWGTIPKGVRRLLCDEMTEAIRVGLSSY